MYDIFFISNSKNNDEFVNLQKRFPLLKHSTTIASAANISFTKMFWVVWPDIIVSNNFKFDLTINQWDEDYVHVFKNGEHYTGILLVSKSTALKISDREVLHRFFVNSKEWDIVASTPKLYDKFIVDTYDEYLYALKHTTTPMFWIVPVDITVHLDFKFDCYFGYDNVYDRNQTHAFVHLEDGVKTYNRVFLCSTSSKLSKNEIEHKFPVDRKEWDIVASTPKLYDKFIVDSYDEYLYALENTTTPMFWIVPVDVSIADTFKFDLYFNYENTYDRNQTHAFVHLEDGVKTYNRVFLCSTSIKLTKKEIDYKFPVDRKEWDIIASTPKLYDKFIVNTYSDYINAFNSTTTPMFWVIPSDVTIHPDFKFDLYFNYENTYDRNQTHAFVHIDHTGTRSFDQILLCSTSIKLTKNEIEYKFPINRKEWNTVASTHKNYDIVFISYNEPNADMHYNALQLRFPAIKRVHKVQGIHNAHVAAATLVDTKMFWVIDADAEILNEFTFNYIAPKYETDIVHTWKSINPINGLTYGYGGVKLLPTQLTKDVDVTSADMTTSISPRFRAMQEVSNITHFNTDPFSTWRSAFRECVKLSSKVIYGQVDIETEQRLDIWCTVGSDKLYGTYAIAGANAGRLYGQENAGNKPALAKINDFNWLLSQFEKL